MNFSPLKNVHSYHLPNGLRVYLKEDPHWPIISAHAWVKAGSVDETASQSGIAHVLEHMVFKGTAHFEAEEISRWMEALGGAMNAETTKEYTHYYIDVPRHGSHKAIQLLGELLWRARFDPVEWKKECPVILEEIKRRNDDPDALLWDLLNEALFNDPSLRRPVIGSPETVASTTPDDLHAFYGKHYNAAETIVVVTGDFKTREMLTWLKQAFGGMSAGTRRDRRFPAYSQGATRQLTLHKSVKQAYFGFAFSTPPAVHPDHEALDVLASILGDGRNSRLGKVLREDKRLVWSLSVGNMTHEGPGVFGIFAEADAAKGPKMITALTAELKKLVRRPPSEKELDRAKNLIHTSWLQSYETSHSQASTIGLFALDNHMERLSEYLPKVLGLSRKHLKEVIEKYLHPLQLAAATIES